MTASARTNEALSRAFAADRAHLFGVCYRLTGSAADADDLVQETFERALATPPPDLERSLRPYLVAVATRLGIDRLRHRQSRAYVGPWLPTPIDTSAVALVDAAPSSEARYGMLESLSFAFLVALEALSPKQRAIVVLRDVFDLRVDEAAEALGIGESDVKVSHHRAREKLATYDAERVPLTKEHVARSQEALFRFLTVYGEGDWQAMAALLREDVRVVNDSDGEFMAARKPVIGRERVVTFHRKLRREGAHDVRPILLNGLPSVLITLPELEGAATRAAFTVLLDREGRIAQLLSIFATEKLAGLPFLREI